MNGEEKKTESSKKRLSWKERLALLPEEEAKALRAKAAEASRTSKARKRGTTPEQALVTRLEAKIAKVDAQLAELKALRTDLAADLTTARGVLGTVVETSATEVGDGKA